MAVGLERFVAVESFKHAQNAASFTNEIPSVMYCGEGRKHEGSSQSKTILRGLSEKIGLVIWVNQNGP